MSSKAKKVSQEVVTRRIETVVQVLSIMEEEAQKMSWFQRFKLSQSFLCKKNIDAFFQTASKNKKKERNMIRKKYRVIDRNENCVLLETIESPKKYKIRDIENDDIMITVDKELAMKSFNKYDIEEVRAEKRRMFESWLEEFCE